MTISFGLLFFFPLLLKKGYNMIMIRGWGEENVRKKKYKSWLVISSVSSFANPRRRQQFHSQCLLSIWHVPPCIILIDVIRITATNRTTTPSRLLRILLEQRHRTLLLASLPLCCLRIITFGRFCCWCFFFVSYAMKISFTLRLQGQLTDFRERNIFYLLRAHCFYAKPAIGS